MSLVLYSVPKEGVGVSAPQSLLPFLHSICLLLIHQPFGENVVALSPVVFLDLFCVLCAAVIAASQ